MEELLAFSGPSISTGTGVCVPVDGLKVSSFKTDMKAPAINELGSATIGWFGNT
jgi:hypothetical protein